METIGPLLIEYGLPGAVIFYLIMDRRDLQKRNDDLVDKLINKNDADRDTLMNFTVQMEKILNVINSMKGAF